MTTFNFYRFLNTLRWDWLSNRGQFNIAAGVFFGVFLFFFFTNGILTMNDADTHTVAVLNNSGLALMMFIFALFTTIGSVFQPLYKGRQPHVHYLMLPASNLEKFLSRHTVYIVGLIVSFGMAFIAADVLQYIAGGIMGVKGNTMIIVQQRDLWTASTQGHDSTWLTVWSFLYLVSLFILGGTLFRKYPALCTFVVIIAVTLLLGATFTHNANNNPGFHFNLEMASDIVNVAMPLLTIINILLAYRLFCRTQLVGRQLLNI